MDRLCFSHLGTSVNNADRCLCPCEAYSLCQLQNASSSWAEIWIAIAPIRKKNKFLFFHLEVSCLRIAAVPPNPTLPPILGNIVFWQHFFPGSYLYSEHDLDSSPLPTFFGWQYSWKNTIVKVMKNEALNGIWFPGLPWNSRDLCIHHLATPSLSFLIYTMRVIFLLYQNYCKIRDNLYTMTCKELGK